MRSIAIPCHHNTRNVLENGVHDCLDTCAVAWLLIKASIGLVAVERGHGELSAARDDYSGELATAAGRGEVSADVGRVRLGAGVGLAAGIDRAGLEAGAGGEKLATRAGGGGCSRHRPWRTCSGRRRCSTS
ncbi:hypothetical protein ON010_g16948 [Phytophthora cinnamomi]|nr:hypothetical protein ON010_g16948 [Phytophthora cinnamomi]